MLEVKDLKFEQALTQLEKLIQEMESGQLSLEQSMMNYEQGVELIKYCRETLRETAMKITTLQEKTNGKLEEQDFILTNRQR